MTRLTRDLPTLSALALAATLLAGCATAPGKPQLGPEETYDGLREVTNAKVSAAWIAPDLDLSGYTKILPVNAGVQYRPASATRRAGPSSSRSTFPISAETRAKFEAQVTEIFRDELGKSQRFELTSTPGPDVLTIVGGLLDVASNVPPQPVGRGDVYLTSVGEATLVLELRDSETNTVLARLVDRRSADTQAGVTWSNTVTNAAEVRRLIRYWATRLRDALDQMPSLTAAED